MARSMARSCSAMLPCCIQPMKQCRKEGENEPDAKDQGACQLERAQTELLIRRMGWCAQGKQLMAMATV
eukprot:scaffold19725_cov18-Tisochrysis_lutea.AAC.1